MATKSRFLALAVVGLSLVVACAAQRVGPPPDPFANPKTDLYNPLRYIASDTLTAVAFSILTITTAALAWNTWKHGAKYMLCMVIGGVFFSIGIALRFGLARDPHSRSIYITEYLFVVLSPCAFIAANYILLGRVARHLDASQYLYVRPNRVTTVFITSDVITFLIQAAGGGTSAVRSQKMRDIGEKIFLVGLVLQLISFVFFCTLFVSFLYRLHKDSKEIWHCDGGKPWGQRWHALATAMGVSCVGILIRSFFRVIEISEGWGGRLATTEAYFYALDTLPLFVAVVIYVPFWPGKYIDEANDTLAGDSDEEKDEGTTGTPPRAAEAGLEMGNLHRPGN